MKHCLILCAVLSVLVGCTDAEWSQVKGYGSKYKVTVFSGGTAVKTFISTGKIANDEHGNGWHFTDSVTNGLVQVSGTVVIEEVK